MGQNDSTDLNGVSSISGHVVAMAFPFGTHAVPLLNLVKRLAILSPNVTFAFISTAKSNRSTFGSTSNVYSSGMANIEVYDVGDGIPENHVPSKDPREDMELFIKSMGMNFMKVIEDELVVKKKVKVSCLIGDAFLWFAGELAQEMNVPWISLWTAGPVSLAAHFYTDLLRETFNLGPDGLAGREEEIVDCIPGLSHVRLQDLPEGVITQPLESVFSVTLHRMGRSLPTASAVVLNSFEELDIPILEPLRTKIQNCLTIGPFTLTATPKAPVDAHGCLPWLDKQKPTSVAYVSFGTVMTPPPHELVALAEGLEESGIPFLWSLKDHLKVHLPKDFLQKTSERGKVVPWTPQEKVLEHHAIGVFVTHCGWNSVLESLTTGVPMICRPFFGDQRLNCRMVSDVWCIGTKISKGTFTKDGMVEALELILCTDEGLKMREKVGALRGLAKHAVGPKGSSTRHFNTLFDIVCNIESVGHSQEGDAVESTSISAHKEAPVLDSPSLTSHKEAAVESPSVSLHKEAAVESPSVSPHKEAAVESPPTNA